MRLHHVAPVALRGMIPFSGILRAAKRRIIRYSDNPANSALAIAQGLDQLSALSRAGISVAGAELLEFGSGWLPIIPLLFHLAGARQVTLTDVERLMDAHTTGLAKERIAASLDTVEAALRLPRDLLLQRLDSFAPRYLVPWRPDEVGDNEVDLVISRATLEHVPRATLASFLRVFHRILRPGGAMCHVIDNSDPWQHSDRSLSRISFLRYSDSSLLWRLAQLNMQAYHNRLRHSDYRAMFEDAGFRVLVEMGEPDEQCLRDLRSIRLAPQFAGRDPRDLCILTSLFVAVKPSHEGS
jgi:cyclopropane fatty-acyl-phospholipid synthase-like methyltransferase